MTCLLCGCADTEHTSRSRNPLRPCEARVLLAPPTLILPEGWAEDCGCPGFEEADEEAAA